MTQTVNDVYIALFRRFREAEEPQPQLAAREITALVCGADPSKMVQWAYSYVEDSTFHQAMLLCDRCIAGEPLAYILGEWDFYGLTFKVNRSVLVPRIDTELLCQLAIEAAQVKEGARVLDLCCGSGCVGIALACARPDVRVAATDISDEALALSRENARLHGVQERYLAFKSDVLVGPENDPGQFDILVSNPPYISEEEMQTLAPSVRDFEPRQALYGGVDGLDFYRAICSKWKRLLPHGGILLCECGYQQAAAVAEIMKEYAFRCIGTAEDTAGVPRVVYARA